MAIHILQGLRECKVIVFFYKLTQTAFRCSCCLGYIYLYATILDIVVIVDVFVEVSSFWSPQHPLFCALVVRAASCEFLFSSLFRLWSALVSLKKSYSVFHNNSVGVFSHAIPPCRHGDVKFDLYISIFILQH